MNLQTLDCKGPETSPVHICIYTAPDAIINASVQQGPVQPFSE